MGSEQSTPHFLQTSLVMLLQTLGEMVPKTPLTDTTQRFHLITELSCDEGFKMLRNYVYYLTVQSTVWHNFNNLFFHSRQHFLKF